MTRPYSRVITMFPPLKRQWLFHQKKKMQIATLYLALIVEKFRNVVVKKKERIWSKEGAYWK